MIIWRYITKELYTHFITIALILLVIFMIFSFIHILSEVSQGQIGLNAVIKIMATEIPSLSQPIIPFSFYLSILMVLNKLQHHHEVVILYACGVSKLMLSFIIILPALCLTIATSLIMLFIYPYTNNLRINIYENAIHEITLQKLTPNQFNKLGKEGIVYSQDMSKNRQKLLNIFFVQNNEDDEPDAFDIILATKAEETTNTSKQKLLNLSYGMRYIGNLSRNNWKLLEFDKYTKVIKSPKLKLEDWPGCLSTLELLEISKYNRYANAELHWRIATPISLLILSFFALILSDTQFKRNKSSLYLPATIIYLLYIDFIFIGMSLIKNKIEVSNIGLWWTHGLMLVTASFFILYKSIFKEKYKLN